LIAHHENEPAADTPAAGDAAVVVPVADGDAGGGITGLQAEVEDSDFWDCFAGPARRDNRYERQSCRDNQGAPATAD